MEHKGACSLINNTLNVAKGSMHAIGLSTKLYIKISYLYSKNLEYKIQQQSLHCIYK